MSSAWFLNSEQKRQAAVRYEANKEFYNPEEKFQWGEVAKALRDWKVRPSLSISAGNCMILTLWVDLRHWSHPILRRYHAVRIDYIHASHHPGHGI
jgi:hypothetical protein